MHPTTALWFGIWIGVALFVSERRWRIPLAARVGAGRDRRGCGPSRSARCAAISITMDPQWASALAGKDYIFPSDWNAAFWLVNMAICRRRRRHTS